MFVNRDVNFEKYDYEAKNIATLFSSLTVECWFFLFGTDSLGDNRNLFFPFFLEDVQERQTGRPSFTWDCCPEVAGLFAVQLLGDG